MHPQYQKIVDAEWDILYDKLERIHKSGAKVVLSKLPIGDVATQVMNSMTHRIPQHVNRVLTPRAHRGSGMTIPEFHQLATEIGERSQYLGSALS